MKKKYIFPIIYIDNLEKIDVLLSSPLLEDDGLASYDTMFDFGNLLNN